MANELKQSYLTSVMGASSTATVAAAAFSVDSQVQSTLSSTNHSNFPLADLVLTFSGTQSVNSGSNFVNVYRRDIDIDGTADSPTPQSTNPAYWGAYVGAFYVPANTATTGFAAVSVPLNDVPLSANCTFYLENRLNIAIGASWTLKVTPKTYVPGA